MQACVVHVAAGHRNVLSDGLCRVALAFIHVEHSLGANVKSGHAFVPALKVVSAPAKDVQVFPVILSAADVHVVIVVSARKWHALDIITARGERAELKSVGAAMEAPEHLIFALVVQVTTALLVRIEAIASSETSGFPAAMFAGNAHGSLARSRCGREHGARVTHAL